MTGSAQTPNTPVLTEDGKRLAEALVKVGILKTGNGWMHPTDDWYTFDVPPALNTAAASLRLSLEGDASLREALEKIACECDPDDPEWKAPASGRALCFRIASAALARPQPEAKGPVAAGVREALADIEAELTDPGEASRYGDEWTFSFNSGEFAEFAANYLESYKGQVGARRLLIRAAAFIVTEMRRTAPTSTTPPAEAKTPDAGVDPSRKLKEALFACLNAGDEFRQYGGELMADGRKAWVRFTAETPEASALLASQPHSRPVGAAQAPEVLTPTGSAGEDDTGVREAGAVDPALYWMKKWGDLMVAYDALAAAQPPAAWQPHPGCSYDNCRSLHECQRPEDCHIVHAPQPPKAETPAGGWEPGMLARNARYDTDGVYPAFGETAFVQRVKRAHGADYLGFGREGEHTYLASLFDPAALSTAPAARPGDEVEPLKAALKPFAAYADPRRRMPADMAVTAGSAIAKCQLTMGDCYAAADALAAAPAADGGRA